MLVKVSVENFKSFDTREELSMLSSNRIKNHKDHLIKIGQSDLLKHAVIYGANASGKSNLLKIFAFIRHVLKDGLSFTSASDFCRNKNENKNRESLFDLQFTIGDKFYAYGFSAVLSKSKITREWIYELLPDGTSCNLFLREGSKKPSLGENIDLNKSEENRFYIYAEDFAGHDTQLFLTEMNRGKKYNKTSNLLFFQQIFTWIMRNMIVISPNTGIPNSEFYNNKKSLETISNLIQTFDTGIEEIKIRTATQEEIDKTLRKTLPKPRIDTILQQLQQQLQSTNRGDISWTLRTPDGFFNIHIKKNSDPEIKTLLLKHEKSSFDFSFGEESDGTKRLFDLIDILATDRPNTVFIVDELERSLHPKLTEHFLKLFMKAHNDIDMQLVFTTHEDTIMTETLFRRDEIWFIERGVDNVSKVYPLDRFKERCEKTLSKNYLDGRYGAIPVFKHFSFNKGV